MLLFLSYCNIGYVIDKLRGLCHNLGIKSKVLKP